MNSNNPSDVREHIAQLKRKKHIVETELNALESKLTDLIRNPLPVRFPPQQHTMVARSTAQGLRRAVENKLETRDGLDLRIGEWQSHLDLLIKRRTRSLESRSEKDSRETEHHEGFRHDENYDTIWHEGQRHELTTNQALVIKFLHEAYQSGHPIVKAARLQEELSIGRVRDSFRGSNLYGRLVISVRHPRGSFRLNLPDPPAKS